MSLFSPKATLPKFKKVVILADSHLGWQEGDYEKFSLFLTREIPKIAPSHFIILGDFFHVWSLQEKFYTSRIQEILKLLYSLNRFNIQCFLLAGNRDLFPVKKNFSPNISQTAPFHGIFPDFLLLNSEQGKKLLLHHGDLINSKDRSYLIWRKLSRSFPARKLVQCFPKNYIQNLMEKVEEKMKGMNSQFRLSFPDKEWIKFSDKCRKKFLYDFLICGHYHPEDWICRKTETFEAIIMKAWMDDQSYGIIDENGNFSRECFDSQKQ